MITRLEVDGFKNLLNFSVDFGPFNCIAGPNGVGKSNVFDAIRFLSLLANYSLTEAAKQIRNNNGSTFIDTRDLFWLGSSNGLSNRIKIAVEMIIQKDVMDELGRQGKTESNYVRYQVEIGYIPPLNNRHFGELHLISEELKSLGRDKLINNLLFLSEEMKDQIIVRDKEIYYISTDRTNSTININEGEEKTSIEVFSMKRTALSNSNSALTPIRLAVKWELASFRLISLLPDSIRRSGTFQSVTYPFMNSDGGGLATTVYDLSRRSHIDNREPEQFYAHLVSKLTPILPIREITVDVDVVREILTLKIKEKGGTWLPAQSLSDGTLRILALAVLSEDSTVRSICIEEPEDGVHPGKLKDLLNLLESIAFDPNFPEDIVDNPLRQVFLVTHSPFLVQIIEPQDLLLATTALTEREGKNARALRLYPLVGTWRDVEGKGVGKGLLLDYLVSPTDVTSDMELESK